MPMDTVSEFQTNDMAFMLLQTRKGFNVTSKTNQNKGVAWANPQTHLTITYKYNKEREQKQHIT